MTQENFHKLLKNLDFFKCIDLKSNTQAEQVKSGQKTIQNEQVAVACSPEQKNIFSREIFHYGQIQQYYCCFFKTKAKLMVLEKNKTLTIFNQDGSE